VCTYLWSTYLIVSESGGTEIIMYMTEFLSLQESTGEHRSGSCIELSCAW
jgi:hypothetical protein